LSPPQCRSLTLCFGVVAFSDDVFEGEFTLGTHESKCTILIKSFKKNIILL